MSLQTLPKKEKIDLLGLAVNIYLLHDDNYVDDRVVMTLLPFYCALLSYLPLYGLWNSYQSPFNAMQ